MSFSPTFFPSHFFLTFFLSYFLRSKQSLSLSSIFCPHPFISFWLCFGLKFTYSIAVVLNFLVLCLPRLEKKKNLGLWSCSYFLSLLSFALMGNISCNYNCYWSWTCCSCLRDNYLIGLLLNLFFFIFLGHESINEEVLGSCKKWEREKYVLSSNQPIEYDTGKCFELMIQIYVCVSALN